MSDLRQESEQPPRLVATLTPRHSLLPLVAAASLLCLGALGGVAARAGGARPWVGAIRVVFWGALSMGLPAGIGAVFGTSAG